MMQRRAKNRVGESSSFYEFFARFVGPSMSTRFSRQRQTNDKWSLLIYLCVCIYIYIDIIHIHLHSTRVYWELQVSLIWQQSSLDPKTNYCCLNGTNVCKSPHNGWNSHFRVCLKFHKSQQVSGWWFGTWLLFSHILGMIIPIDELISFRGVGWNHQPLSTINHH